MILYNFIFTRINSNTSLLFMYLVLFFKFNLRLQIQTFISLQWFTCLVVTFSSRKFDFLTLIIYKYNLNVNGYNVVSLIRCL